MRQIIEENFLRLVRFYTYNTPINKGKYRTYKAALRLCKSRPDSLPVRLKDGRRFFANLTTGMQETLFFIGEVEKVLTEITVRLIVEGDVCIDAGANFGWYTSLMALHTGSSGAVHAFEPMPHSFDELKRNHELMDSPEKVVINNVALGDRSGSINIHVFDGLVSGYASLAAKGGVVSATFDCKMTTMDKYLEEKGIAHVDFVKVDIEGAELMFLKGATSLFSQDKPPIFLMEMAAGQTANFGYHPNQLIEFIGSHGDYEFFSVDEYKGTVRLIDGFDPDDIGANVFCIPRATPEKRAVLADYLVE